MPQKDAIVDGSDTLAGSSHYFRSRDVAEPVYSADVQRRHDPTEEMPSRMNILHDGARWNEGTRLQDRTMEKWSWGVWRAPDVCDVCRGQEMGVDVCCAPGGSEERYVLRVAAKSRDVLPDPLQRSALVIECYKYTDSA